jgi:hypothetical protein
MIGTIGNILYITIYTFNRLIYSFHIHFVCLYEIIRCSILSADLPILDNIYDSVVVLWEEILVFL